MRVRASLIIKVTENNREDMQENIITSEKNSNIELLRIAAMLMIITFHILVHCIIQQLTDNNIITARGTEYFCYPGFSRRLMILSVIRPLGQVGNAIFIVVSGYFMANRGGYRLTLPR